MEVDDTSIAGAEYKEASIVGFEHTGGLPTFNLPQCANEGCTNKVFYDDKLPEELRYFKYCSVSCRNKWLFGHANETEKEIKVMEIKLSSQRTSLKEFQHTETIHGMNQPSSSQERTSTHDTKLPWYRKKDQSG